MDMGNYFNILQIDSNKPNTDPCTYESNISSIIKQM